VAHIQAQLDAWAPPRPPRNGPPRRSGGQREPSPRRLRRRRFAAFQSQWRKSRGRVLKKVLSGEDLIGTPALPEGSQAFWRGLFSRPSPEDHRSPSPIRRVGSAVMGPATEEELKAVLAATPKGTAPGLDGRCYRDIEELGMTKLGWVVDGCLWLGTLPSSWAHGRTTMLPKTSRPSTPGDLRPITITPLITRIIHKLLAKRLNHVAPLPWQQKGFKQEEGCAANIAIIRALVRQAQQQPSSLYVAWVDFKKAFDSVGHPSLLAACKRWGLPARLTKYISHMYEMAATQLDEDSPPVNITRGVLQGDPLSPFLFNICLDWALADIPQNVGVHLGECRVNYLAFADDVAITASTRSGLQAALNRLVSSAGLAGLEVGVRKCATLGVLANKKRKTWAQDTVPFSIAGHPVQVLAPGEFYKYLGVQMGAGDGGTAHLLHQQLAAKMDRLLRAPARPQQKFWGFKNVLVPQLLYPLVNMAATKGQLGRMDRAIRRGGPLLPSPAKRYAFGLSLRGNGGRWAWHPLPRDEGPQAMGGSPPEAWGLGRPCCAARRAYQRREE